MPATTRLALLIVKVIPRMNMYNFMNMSNILCIPRKSLKGGGGEKRPVE